MKKITNTSIIIVLLLVSSVSQMFGQTLTNAEYVKAGWMTIRMYGGQRSGDGSNWLIMDHTPSTTDMNNLVSSKGAVLSQMTPKKCFTKDADGATSLSGGWVDCGDHVKFGQTMFYSAYTLLKGYDAFPAGYDDYYSYNYAGYQSSGDFTFEGAKGGPNGIPDILDELKYQCEFFIKCTPNSTTFYSQVGNGDLDHLNWVTSVAMASLPKSQGGQADGARAIVKNPTDASMPSFCAATLALMSRVYAKFDPAFAATCLTHAVYAYTYAKAHPGTTSAGSFYPANAKWQDDFACACAELFWATNTASYKTEALSYAGNLGNHNWCYNYNNNDDIAAYNLAKLGSTTALTLFNSFASTYKAAVNASGLYTGGDASWGPLRYNANAAFIVALWGAYNGGTTVDQFVYKNVDYILGGNSSKFSFVVGFKPTGGTCAVHPHHRNVYLINDLMANQNTMTIPTHNAQFGYMIGGSRTVPFTESATNYQTSEGGIDYNAGLVGAIAYINSIKSPVNLNKFGHPTPDLGPDVSICGVASILLDSRINTDTKKTYTWKKDGTTVVSASTTAKTYTATSAGTYICQIDSVGWSTSDEIIITSTLPDVSLGADKALCNPSWDTLRTAATGAGITYEWKKNGAVISGATTSSYKVYNAGTYICTISATGCTAKSDEIIVTSSLPTVVHDTICAAGTANLSVSTAGTYTWYNVLTGGTSLASGATYSPTISATTTYYVQDASSMSGTVGPTTRMSTGSNWGISNGNHLKFTVGSNFTLNSLKLNFGQIYNNATGTLTIEILDSNGNAFSPAKTFVSDQTSVTTAQSSTLVQFNFTNCNIDKAWGTDLRMRISACSINAELIYNTTGATYPYNSTPAGAVTITGTAGGDGDSNDYMYFYDWKFSSGSSCARTPVLAVLDPAGNCGDTQAPTTPGTITFSSITTTGMTASWTASTDNVAVTGYEVYVNGTLHSTVTTNSVNLTGLTCNTAYAVRIRAKDAAGNYSSYNTQASATTSNVATPTITNSTPTICAGATISLSIPTVTGGTYAWSGPNSYTATTAAISRTTATTAMSGTYSVTQTVSGCTSTAATTTVTVNAIPATPVITNSTPTICAGATITVSIPTVTGGTYAWSGPNSYTANTAAISRTSSTTAMSGTYSVTQTVSGCTSTAATTTVTVNATPATPVITNSTPTICAGNTISLSIPTVTGGTYAWSGPSSYTATTAAISRTSAITAMSGTYSVTQTVSGCTSTAATTTVTVNAIPTAPTVSTPISYPQGATASPLTATGTGLLWYTSSTGGTGSSTAPTPSTATVGTTYYYVSQTTSGCESPRSQITVNIITATVTQTISLDAGWNLISFNVQPSNTSIESVFGTALSSVEYVKNADGFYKTGQAAALQSLTQVALGYSYLVKMTTPQTISVSGTAPGVVTVPLKLGWNMLGYPKTTTGNTTTVLSGIWSNVQIIKNFDAFLDNSSGTLTTMTPGEGYYIYMTAPSTITY